MTILSAPTGTLTDDAVTLRLPSRDAGDIATVKDYVQNEQLGGGWLPDVPLLTADELVTGWLDAWSGRPSHADPAFVVTIPGHAPFVGVLGMREHGGGVVEITYGTAPRWRGRGVASHAAMLAVGWIASQHGVRRVEARITQGDRAGERVAVHAGFELADPVQPISGTGQIADDLRYVYNPPAPKARSS